MWPSTIHRAIDFMVRTESFSYLFTTIFQALQSYKAVGMFMKELEEYIESGCIKCMTEEILHLTVDHYLGISEQEAQRRMKRKEDEKKRRREKRKA